MKDAIVLEDISHSFDCKQVLKKLSLTIKSGTFHSLIGISGVGKTLTLKLISSLLPLQSGAIQGRPNKISYAFQTSPLIPWLTIKENLRICTSDYLELDNLLAQLHLENLSTLYPSQLSGGMIQRINILRSFLGKPDLILMDEPFVHIDSIQKEDLHKFLINLWNVSRPTIIFVTHDIDEAIYLSQYISLYSLKAKSITETFQISENIIENFPELRNSSHFNDHFKKIYSHLKQDQSL